METPDGAGKGLFCAKGDSAGEVAEDEPHKGQSPEPIFGFGAGEKNCGVDTGGIVMVPSSGKDKNGEGDGSEEGAGFMTAGGGGITEGKTICGTEVTTTWGVEEIFGVIKGER